MFWAWTLKSDNSRRVSWGSPRSLDKEAFENCAPEPTIKIYRGEDIKAEDKIIFSMQGDSTLGMGDSVWLISYLREIYSIKGRRRCQLDVATSAPIARFYSHFFPKTIRFLEEYVTLEELKSYHHILPAMFCRKEQDGSDRSWVNNKSILERMYDCVGLEYQGLPDWGDFTPEYLAYPDDAFYERLRINKSDKYVFFQWHSSGLAKNLPPSTNLKIIRHIINTYGLKVYILGISPDLDQLEIPGVKNLSTKTTAEDVFALAFNAEFIVCPDSAGVHLGEAYRIPTVGIMSTLPPVYVASKYRIPAFMYGTGFCPHRPCGHTIDLPVKDKCPSGTKHYCAILQDVDLQLFDKCVSASFDNRRNLRKKPSVDFYHSQREPICMT